MIGVVTEPESTVTVTWPLVGRPFESTRAMEIWPTSPEESGLGGVLIRISATWADATDDAVRTSNPRRHRQAGIMRVRYQAAGGLRGSKQCSSEVHLGQSSNRAWEWLIRQGRWGSLRGCGCWGSPVGS